MPNPPILTMQATLQCSDQGTIAPQSSAKLTVNNQPVLIEASIKNKLVACPLNESKCTTVQEIQRIALAKRVTVNNEPVIVSIESFATTDTGKPVTATNAQKKLTVKPD